MKKLLAGLVCLLSACASAPVIPDGMIILPKAEINQVLEKYTQQQEQLQEFEKLRAWRDSMFF